MLVKCFEDLPKTMQTPIVKEYYDLLSAKRGVLAAKRSADILIAAFLLFFLFPILLILAVVIRLESPGPILFRQVRVTAGLKKFQICKFRTMCDGADKMGPLVTVGPDRRVTRVGVFLRKTRLDELPQLINVLKGDMTLVGTRPEVPHFVQAYEPEMLATLLLPAGVTSQASIRFRDEAELLEHAENADEFYIGEILPQKMRWNLEYLRNFSLKNDLRIIVDTVKTIF